MVARAVGVEVDRAVDVMAVGIVRVVADRGVVGVFVALQVRLFENVAVAKMLLLVVVVEVLLLLVVVVVVEAVV